MLHGIDRRTGKARWTYLAATIDGGQPEFHGRALVTPDLVVVGSDDRRSDGVGYVYAFQRPGLELAWKRRLGAGTMTDIVNAGDLVYVVTLDDELVALDLQSGAIRWRSPSGSSNERFFPGSTPAVMGDRLVFGGLNGVVRAFNAKSGAVLWHRTLDARVSTSVAAVGADVILGDATGRVHRLNGATGASEAELRLDGAPIFRLVPVDDALLFYVNDSNVTSLKSLPLTLDAVRWSQAVPSPGWTSLSSLFVWKDMVIVGTESGELAAFALVDGRPTWRARVAGRIAGVGGDETSLYVGTVKGTVYSLVVPAIRH